MRNNMKIEFHPITMQDREWMTKMLMEDEVSACEYTFANNFIWGRFYQAEVARIENCGVIRTKRDSAFCYSFPFGAGDKKRVLELLMEECHKQGQKLSLYPVEENGREFLEKNFPGQFLLQGIRDGYDYVYTVEKLAYLKGKKLHGKRNHIARFMDDEDWSYEPLTQENKEDCREMAREWISLREEKWNEDMEREMRVLQTALDHFEELHFVGGVLRKKGQIVAFTIGERLNSNTIVVHFEKAFPTLQGAYPMINQQFVQHIAGDYQYVNREEDTGDLGLRKAKMSYYPDRLVTKYEAVESEIVYATQQDFTEIRKIWNACFGDEDAYINLYLENRFTKDNMLVLHKDGKIVSMASCLPISVQIDGEMKPATYIYAVATLPEYRKQGNAGKILEAAKRIYGTLILQPAEEHLIDYYGKMGFEEAFQSWNREVSLAELETQADIIEEDMLCEVDAGEYMRIRDERFHGDGYVQWDLEAVTYALKENHFCGGKAVKILTNTSKEDILLYRIFEQKIYVVETSLSEDELNQVLLHLMKKTESDYAVIRNAGGMISYAEGGHEIQNGYLNLTLG